MNTPELISKRAFRFSGHQTFPLRIAWIPKALGEIAAGNDPLADIDLGITKLGLGKNMVEALRCWIEAFQIASKDSPGSEWKLTTIGQMVFSPTEGLDPYLEDHSSSWLLHWLICTNVNAPFFAWECLFNRWPSNEFSASPVLDSFRQAAEENPKAASTVTLKQHWEVFVHSYRPPRGGKGEDHLDCALSVLGLIREAGETQNAAGKWETRFEFDMSHKFGIPQQLFAFFVHDWWNAAFPLEQTISIRELVHGDRSPGRILKMQEGEVVLRVAELARAEPHVFELTESANLRQLRRLRKKNDGFASLRATYRSPRLI